MSADGYRVSMSRVVYQLAPDVFRIMEDVEDFPEFMPHVTEVKLVSTEGNRKVANWDIMLDDAPLSWVEEGTYDCERLRIDFRSIDGIFDRFDGFWQVVQDGGRSHISFSLTYAIGLPEIEDIVGPVLYDRMIENVQSMLDAIERRLGSRQSP